MSFSCLPLLRKYSTLWTLLLCIIPLLGWWTYGLFDLDEGFYAAITSEMNRRGDWVTPLYNGHPWFEKPILLYWLAKPCLAIFGEAFGPRLPDILAAIGTYGILLWFGKRHLGTRSAIFSTIVLATSPLVVGLGRMMMTDAILMFCVSAALLSFWMSLLAHPRWRIVSAVFLGLGVLAKGPITGILFLPPVIWMGVRHPELRARFKGGWVIGTVCFGLVVASWYVPAYLANGQIFVQQFLILQNIGRFSGGDQAHTLEGWKNLPVNLLFYPVIILICYLPWSGFLVKAWKQSNQNSLSSFLKAWFLTVLIFFTITKAKLPHYILPLSVPLAILVGQHLAQRTRDRRFPLAWPVGALVGVTFLANFGFLGYYYGVAFGPLQVPGGQPEIHELARYVRNHARPQDVVAEYKMGRQQHDRGTGNLKIQETKEPSVLLYLNRDTLETDDFDQILGQKGKVWILTRTGRIGTAEIRAAGPNLLKLQPFVGFKYFSLYLLQR